MRPIVRGWPTNGKATKQKIQKNSPYCQKGQSAGKPAKQGKTTTNGKAVCYNSAAMKKITLQDWKNQTAPKGTIYTGTRQPYLRTQSGERYDITEGLAREIKRIRREVLA